MERKFYVYILASEKNGTLYIGYTNNLSQRISQHKSFESDSFTKKYKVDKLVYFEEFTEPLVAINREKCLKKWNREWKLKLIESINPDWQEILPY